MYPPKPLLLAMLQLIKVLVSVTLRLLAKSTLICLARRMVLASWISQPDRRICTGKSVTQHFSLLFFHERHQPCDQHVATTEIHRSLLSMGMPSTKLSRTLNHTDTAKVFVPHLRQAWPHESQIQTSFVNTYLQVIIAVYMIGRANSCDRF